MYTKKTALILLPVICLFIGYLWRQSLTSYHLELPISYSQVGYPLVKINVEDSPMLVDLDIGSKYPLCLSNEHLHKLRKTVTGEASWHGADGKAQRTSLYRIPVIKLGSHQLRNMEALEVAESAESFTWPLADFNVLLDLPHQKVWGMKKERSWRSTGIDLKKMEKVPCHIDSNGISLTATTLVGDLQLGLTPRCMPNIINAKLWNKNDYLNMSVSYEGNELGTADFYPVDLPPELELDGLLGVGFLAEHMVYIDAKQQCLYIGGKHGNTLGSTKLQKISLEFTVHQTPITTLTIGESSAKVLIDLGSDTELVLPPSLSPSSSWIPLGSTQSVNVWGEMSSSTSYSIPNCKIGGLEIWNVRGHESDDLPNDTGIPCHSDSGFAGEYGKLGRPFLERTSIYADFKRSALWTISNERDLKKIGVDLTNYQRIPFQLNRYGILLKTYIDSEPQQLLIDTGASISALRRMQVTPNQLHTDHLGNPCYCSETFQILGIDYGKQHFYPLDLSPEWECDGVLGMDFLREHAFYIDYPNRVIYLEKP